MHANIACTAQLLWMAGKINRIVPRQLDAHIGRKPGQPDINGGSDRLLFEAGFTAQIVRQDPPEDVLDEAVMRRLLPRRHCAYDARTAAPAARV
jgi:hypothetical protein